MIKSIVSPPEVFTYRMRNSGFDAWTTKTGTLDGSSATCVTFSHKAPYATSGDNGGPFMVTKNENSWHTVVINHSRYEGAVSVGAPVNPGGYSANTGGSVKTDAELDQKGTTAIARCEPTNPAFDAATAIGELRMGGMPAASGSHLYLGALQSRVKAAKAAGPEYLNAEFGWIPLVRDLNTLAKAVHESHQIMASYRKGSDTKMMRSFHYPEENNTVYYKGSMLPVPVDFGSFLAGWESSHQTSSMWFKGAFRYHLPTSDSQMNKFEDYKQRAAKLYGLRLTPETVWNLAPWSWAADWFANTGDLLHNVSALGHDGLVMQYGYMMAQTEHNRTRMADTSSGSVSHNLRTVIRQRRPASPYGFGANLQSLSGKQVAVLAALGLSRR